LGLGRVPTEGFCPATPPSLGEDRGDQWPARRRTGVPASTGRNRLGPLLRLLLSDHLYADCSDGLEPDVVIIGDAILGVPIDTTGGGIIAIVVGGEEDRQVSVCIYIRDGCVNGKTSTRLQPLRRGCRYWGVFERKICHMA